MARFSMGVSPSFRGGPKGRARNPPAEAGHGSGFAPGAPRNDTRLPSRGALELAQHRVAARDRGVERLLGRLLPGERGLDLLGPDVAQLHHVAEAKPARVLGRLLVGELEERRLEVGRILVV